MKTRIINRKYIIKLMISLLVLFVFSLFGLNLNAGAAGTPKKPSKSASELRKEANAYFDQGLQLQESGKYKEASNPLYPTNKLRHLAT